MITKESIEQLKLSIDIVDVISHYITLKKSGTNYVAKCPFHEEKSASFNVNQNMQFYKCFGCGAGGDAISFVKEYEKLSYPEAIEKIASIFNFSLKYDKEGGRDYSKVLDGLNSYFKHELFNNKEALEYLKKRNISDSSIERFSIGYAPITQKVVEFLRQKAYPPEDAIKSGVMMQNDKNSYYFRFEERITFPITTAFGKIVGFGGRTLGKHKAKYLNSPQSAIFNKSKLLYGYFQAKDEIYTKKEVVVTEGYLDVIMLHQAGYKNSVATLGTALNSGHIPLLKKENPKVIIAYDGDSAGREAAFKAANLMLSSEIEGSVVLFEDGLDPADLVTQNRLDVLSSIFQQKKPFLDYILETLFSKVDISNPHQKQRVYGESLALIKNFPLFVAEEGAKIISFGLKVPLKNVLNDLRPSLKDKSGDLKTNIVNKKIDLLEGCIIKSCYQDEETLSYVLDIIDDSFFINYRDEFLAMLHKDLEHKGLQEILINQLIIPSSKEVIRVNLVKLIENRCKRDIEYISKTASLKEEEKRFRIREIRLFIDRLKKGEVMVYESIGTI